MRRGSPRKYTRRRPTRRYGRRPRTRTRARRPRRRGCRHTKKAIRRRSRRRGGQAESVSQSSLTSESHEVKPSALEHHKNKTCNPESGWNLKFTTYNHLSGVDTAIYKKGNAEKYCVKELDESADSSGLSPDPKDFVYVLWVRHCESCANIALKMKILEYLNLLTLPDKLIQKMYRTPLCTDVGIEQAKALGRNLRKRMKSEKEINSKSKLTRLPDIDLRFYSSYLPRTFHTAQNIAKAYYGKDVSGEKVKRLCYISEETKFYDNPTLKRSGGIDATQSTISPQVSNCYAVYLNNKDPQSQPVQITTSEKPSEYECEDKRVYKNKRDNKGTTIIAGQGEDTLPHDYIQFYDKYIKQSDNNNEELQSDKLQSGRLNVIVSHGGYIRMNVLQSDNKHPNNTEAYLVKYSKKEPKAWVLKSFFDPKTQSNSVVSESLKKNLKKNDVPYSSGCEKYKYNKNILRVVNNLTDDIRNKSGCPKLVTESVST